MTNAILFDLWNTLLYCPTREKVEEIIEVLGLSEEADYHKVIDEMGATLFTDCDYGEETFFENLCMKNSVECSKEDIKQAINIWESRLEGAKYFPETEEVLEDLRGDYHLALVSNVDATGAEHARKLFLKKYFDAVIMSCEVGSAKPYPQIFEHAMDAVGARAQDAWMVGDSLEYDVKAALKCGLNAVLVDRQGKHQGTEYRKIADLAQLRKVIT